MAAGRAQYRQQLFAGRVAALIEQILAEARLGIERIVDWAHQHQHANPLTALDPAAFNQLIDRPAQGMAVDFKARGQLLFSRKVVAAAIVMA